MVTAPQASVAPKTSLRLMPSFLYHCLRCLGVSAAPVSTISALESPNAFFSFFLINDETIGVLSKRFNFF